MIVALHTSEMMAAARHIYEDLGFKEVREMNPRYGKKYFLYKLVLKRRCIKKIQVVGQY